MSETRELLRVENLETSYGQSQVLFGVSLVVRSGEAVCRNPDVEEEDSHAHA